MPKQFKIIETIEIPNPCTIGWNNLNGNDSVRHCHKCNSFVYNLETMTNKQIEELALKNKDKLCARITIKADGTIKSLDKQLEIKRINTTIKVTKTILTTITAMLFSFYSSVHAKTIKSINIPYALDIKNDEKTESKPLTYNLCGIVYDLSRAIIADAEITVINENTNEKFVVRSNNEGQFFILLPISELYTVTIDSPGFQTFFQNHIKITNESLRLEPILQIAATTDVVIVTSSVEVTINGGAIMICRKSKLKRFMGSIIHTVNKLKDHFNSL